MKFLILILLVSTNALAQKQNRASYFHPTFTSGKHYNRYGADGLLGVGPSTAFHGNFFKSNTELPTNDLTTWEARAGASFLYKNDYLFKLLAIFRDEPFKVSAKGLAPSIRIPIHSLWNGTSKTIVGLDIEWLKYKGLSANNSASPDNMTQVMIGPNIRQELMSDLLYFNFGHDQYFYDEDSLAARRGLNSRLQTFNNSGAILFGFPDNTTYSQLDAYLGEWLTVSPRLSTSKSLELNNRTFVTAVASWLRLPFISIGVDVGTQTSKGSESRQNFFGITFAL